jgi:hypothetical protein
MAEQNAAPILCASVRHAASVGAVGTKLAARVAPPGRDASGGRPHRCDNHRPRPSVNLTSRAAAATSRT